MEKGCARKKTAEIKRVSPDVSGRPDGVEATIECVVNEFELDAYGEPIRFSAFPSFRECKIVASRSGGTATLSVQGKGTMLTIGLDDLADLLKAVDDASKE